MKHLIRGGLAAAGLSVAACGASTKNDIAIVPPDPCRDGAVRPNPLVVDWPTSLRSDLEMLRSEGLVAVRWKGCNIEILQQCHLEGGYTYHALTPKHDEVHIYNDADLHANLPFYGAQFGAQLKRSGELKVKMDIVGAYQVHTHGVTELRGDCREATHVVTSMNIGAFRFYTAKEEIDDVEVKGPGGVGAGGTTLGGKVMLASDGDFAHCAEGLDTSAAPPAGCTATLRIEMRPLAARVDDEDAPVHTGVAPHPKHHGTQSQSPASSTP